MLNYDWENSIGYWICATSHIMRKTLDARLTKEGITIRQWEVLAWLSARGCGSQSELADQLGIEPHMLVGVLDRMETAELLIRRSSTEDRRKKTIHPTEKADELWKRVSIISRGIRDQAIQGLSQEDLDNLKRLCSQIHNNFSELSSSDSEFNPCRAVHYHLDEKEVAGTENQTA